LLFTAIVAVTTYSASAFASEPLWRGDLETGDLSQWSPKLDVNPGSTDRLVVVSDPVREGRSALRATVKYGDLINNGARAEVVLATPQFREGDERWFHWYTMFPADFVASPSWQLVTQWHSNAFGFPLAFGLHGETLSFRVMAHQYDAAGQWDAGTLWKAPLQRGTWNEYLLHVKFSDNSSVGFVELWFNGSPVVPKTMHATLDSGDTAYLKMGLYRNRTIDWDQSVYHDGMSVYAEDPRVGGSSTVADDRRQPGAPSDHSVLADDTRGCGSEQSAAAVLFIPAPFILRLFRRRGRRRGASSTAAKDCAGTLPGR
jgi:hypothetical protein